MFYIVLLGSVAVVLAAVAVFQMERKLARCVKTWCFRCRFWYYIERYDDDTGPQLAIVSKDGLCPCCHN